jgi:hypothetical protein
MATQEDDRTKLVEFVKSAHRFVARIVEEGIERFPPSLQPLIQRAWRDLQPSFDAALSGLAVVERDDLRAVGLSGDQLALKLTAYSEAARDAGKGWITKAIKKVLEVIDAILDSLAKAVPGFQVFKEFKDIIKAVLPD